MRRPLHGLHAALLAGAVPLWLGVLLCDLAYSSTYEIQWKNFASWLLVGALIFAGGALAWAIVDGSRERFRHPPLTLYALLLVALWLLGFINALLHSADTAASLSTALLISWIVAALAIAATWLGFSGPRREVAA